MSKSTQLHWKIAFCLWFAVVTTATHVPAMQKSENPVFISPDKMFHFVSFGVLAMTLWSSGWIKQKRTVVCLLLFWALIDEITQALLPLDRPFSIADLTASMLGIFAAASWMGNLSLPQFLEIQTKVDTLLSRTFSWIVLCPVAIVGTVGISFVIWKILWKTYLVSYAPLSLCLGLLITTAVLLAIVSKWARCLENEIIIKILPKTFVLVILALIAGFVTSAIEVGSYTIGLSVFTIGSARIWRAAIIDNSTCETM